MKPKIHPEYGKTTITCACGAVYHVGSTKKNIKVEICAKCHPFFTGVQKIVDTTGRVERFMRKYGYITQDKEGKDKAGGKGEGKADAVVETKAPVAGEARGDVEVRETGEGKTKEKAKAKKAKTAEKAEKAEDKDKAEVTGSESDANQGTAKKARSKRAKGQGAEARAAEESS